MIVVEHNRTILRSRDILASVTPGPGVTLPSSFASRGAAETSGADAFEPSVFGSALRDVPFVVRDSEFPSQSSAGGGRRAHLTGLILRREVALPSSSITGTLKA